MPIVTLHNRPKWASATQEHSKCKSSNIVLVILDVNKIRFQADMDMYDLSFTVVTLATRTNEVNIMNKLIER